MNFYLVIAAHNRDGELRRQAEGVVGQEPADRRLPAALQVSQSVSQLINGWSVIVSQAVCQFVKRAVI